MYSRAFFFVRIWIVSWLGGLNQVAWIANASQGNALYESLVISNSMKVLPTLITHPATIYRMRTLPVMKKEGYIGEKLEYKRKRRRSNAG